MSSPDGSQRGAGVSRHSVAAKGEAPQLHEVQAIARGTMSPRHGRRDYLLRRALAVSDMAAIGISGLLAFAVDPGPTDRLDALWLLPTLPLWVLLFRAYGLYERDVKRINHGALDDIPQLVHALLIGTLLLWTYYRFLSPTDRLVLVDVAVFGTGALVLVPALRSLARRIVSKIMGPERVVFLGESPTLPGLIRKIRTHPEYGLEPIGVVPATAAGAELPIPALGRLDGLNLERLVQRHAVDRVIVDHAEVDDPFLLELLQECGRLSLKVSILPRYLDALGPSVEVDEIEGVTVLDLNPLVLPRSSRMFKRLMDVVGSALALIAFAPAMAVIAAAIRLDSRGPVLFRQERIGRRGRCFELLKFRTMLPDAESRVEDLRQLSTDPDWLHLENDPRITRVGRLLRQFSLDELPQFINVLKGEMSLVGPRPLVGAEDMRVRGWARTRLDLAPGITGLWQVLGRTNIPFAEMIKLDTLYVTNWTLWLDVKLLLRTFPIVLRRQGVN